MDIALPVHTGWIESDRAELARLAQICVAEMARSSLRVTGGLEDADAVARIVGSFSDVGAAHHAATALRARLASPTIQLLVADDESSCSVMVEFRNRGYFANEHSDRAMQSGAH